MVMGWKWPIIPRNVQTFLTDDVDIVLYAPV